MSSADSSRRSEILRAEESIRQLAGEIGRYQESRDDLLRVEESLQAAIEAVKAATAAMGLTRDHFDKQMDSHESRVQDLTQEVEKRFQLSAERFDASIDTLTSVRRRIEEEADRLHSIRGEIRELLQASESRIETRFKHLDEKITEVLAAFVEVQDRLDLQSQDAGKRQEVLIEQLGETQRQLRDAIESTRTEMEAKIAALNADVSQLSSRTNYGLGAMGVIAVLVMVVIVLIAIGI